MVTHPSPARQLADWYELAGASLDVGDEPVAWAHKTEAAPPPAPPARTAPQPTTGAGPATAMALARAAKTLEQLQAILDAFDGCPLRKTAMSTVFADGDPASRVMLIGEAPGAEEDRTGRPFVGQAGQLLDRMLAAIGRDRAGPPASGAYITNMVFWRPPGNRNPSPQELDICRPFVERHIALVRPHAILALGGIAAKALLGTETGITRLRGAWQDIRIEDRAVPVLPTFHPAFLLRSPGEKRNAWRDLIAFKLFLDEARHAD